MWRTVIVTAGERLNIKDNWLVVSNQEGESKVPVSDIYSLVIENRSAMLSVSVLTTLTQAGAHIILCDTNHLPVTTALPLNTHYRPFNVIKKQLELSQNFKDKLWQKIVEKKMRIRYAIEMYVKSLVTAIECNDVEFLRIPELIVFDEFFEDEDD